MTTSSTRASHPLVPAAVGTLVAAVVGAAAARSSRPWTFAMDTGNGFLGQTLPAYRAWMSGRVPEWSDLLWGGFPLLGDPSNAALYPPHLLAYLATLGSPLRFFDVALALHLGLLAAGAAYLVRQLGGGTPAQALAGLLSALCPSIHYSAFVYFPAFASQAWWPWAFAAAERLARPSTPVLGGAMVLGWIALGAQVLAGMPEQATYGAVVTSAWLLTRRAGLGLGGRIVRLAILGMGALAVAAPQLLPTLAYLGATTRGAPLAGDLTQAAAISVARPEQLLVAGTGVLNGIPSFFGLATLALAVIAVAARRPRAAFLVALAVIAFALATGPATPLYGWLQHVPPFDHFRTPLKLQVPAELALAVAAALGADAGRASRLAWARGTAAALALAAVVERGVYVAQEVPLFRMLADRTSVDPAVVDALARTPAVRARRPDEPPPLVLDVAGSLGGETARSLGAVVGLSSLRPYPVALIAPMHERLINRPATGPELPTLLGVRYLLAAPLRCQQYVARFRWPRVDESPHFCMLENPVPVQRWTVVREAIAVPDEDAMLERVRAQPAGPVPVLAPPGMVPPTGDGVVALRSYAPGRARLSVTAHTPSLVLVRDSFLPGWNVAVDGTPVPIHPAAGIYFAVPVPAGVHDVVLEYRAPGFRAGVLVLLAWTLGAVGWWRVRARRMAVR